MWLTITQKDKIMLVSYLAFGFLVGIAHAFEADHLATVGALAAENETTPGRIASLGAVWGLGHSLTMMIMGCLVLLFGLVLSEFISDAMEFFVGCILAGLGLHILFRLLTKSRHQHAGQTIAEASSGRLSSQVRKTFLVGLAHGAAGSAAVLVAVTAATNDAITALLYIFLFALGSFSGMALLTSLFLVPTRLKLHAPKKLLTGLQFAAASVAVVIGGNLLLEKGASILKTMNGAI